MTDDRTRSTVADIMSAPPITIDVCARTYRAVALLREHGIRHLPVLRQGTLVGMLSERDLLPRMHPVGAVMAGDPQDVEVGALMGAEPIVVTSTDPVAVAVTRMLEHHVGGLPVVDPDDGSVCGVVTYVDVLRALGTAA